MYEKLSATIQKLNWKELDGGERKKRLQPLVDFIQQKVDSKQKTNLNFICTHNSRRSHLSQIWAQVASEYFGITNVNCYSGGAEETAVFPKVMETLSDQGFNIFKIADGVNPVYAVKYDENVLPIIGFSKKYDSEFNPQSEFVAIMTCSQADGGCPFITGAEKRIPITFEDPKVSDNTPEQTQVYLEGSLQIATEMFYIFSQIKQ